MNARKPGKLARSGNRQEAEEALAALVSIAETLATAVLELAGERPLESGADPLSRRSRVLLEDWVGLAGEGREG